MDNKLSITINKELEKWDNKVLYNVRFKDDTKADLNKLNRILHGSLQHFTLIAANSEALVYKIGRYFVTEGVKFDNFNFIDGEIVKAYISSDGKDWSRKDRIDQFIEIFGSEFDKKWVMIPCMSFKIEVGLAIYFAMQIRKCHATGIIWYAVGPDNFTEVLVHQTELDNFYQFPDANFHKKRRKQLPEDEW